MDETIALLIMAGHHDIWTYGYTFFKTCCNALAKAQKQQILNMAVAIGLVLGGQKAIDEFVKD